MSDFPRYDPPPQHFLSTFSDLPRSPSADYVTTIRDYSVSFQTLGAANRGYFYPVLVTESITIRQMAVMIGTASGNIDVGIYGWADPGGGGTFNRIVSAGSTAAAGSSARQVFNITDTPLVPGNYWLAVSGDNTTVTLRVSTSRDRPSSTTTGFFCMESAFPLPSTATQSQVGAHMFALAAYTHSTAV